MVSWKVWKRTHQRQWTLVGGAYKPASHFEQFVLQKKTNRKIDFSDLDENNLALIRASAQDTSGTMWLKIFKVKKCLNVQHGPRLVLISLLPVFVLSWSVSILFRKNFVLNLVLLLRLSVRPGKDSTSSENWPDFGVLVRLTVAQMIQIVIIIRDPPTIGGQS